MTSIRCTTTIVLLVILGSTAHATENPYWPTRIGASWHYVDSSGAEMWLTIVESGSFEGHDVVTRDVSVCCGGAGPLRGDKIGTTPSGALIYFGWESYTSDSYGIIDPPQMIAPEELGVGMEWTTTSIEREYSGGALTSERDLASTYSVVGFETVVTQAGEFQAFQIERYTNVGPTRQPAADACSDEIVQNSQLGLSADLFYTDWIAEGVGLVKRLYPSGATLELVDFTSGGVPVKTTSWGAVKARFE